VSLSTSAKSRTKVPVIYWSYRLFWGRGWLQSPRKLSYLLVRSPQIGFHTLDNDQQIDAIATSEGTTASNPVTHDTSLKGHPHALGDLKAKNSEN
jgi:hypothetical protein